MERDDLLRDEEYRRSSARTTRRKFGVRVWHRDFFDAEIVDCPDASVIGKSFGQVGTERGGLHPVDAFLDLVLEHGTGMRWRTTISNHRPEVLKKMAREPGIQMGFSDAGAHLRNMAFYNCGLRLLRHVRDAERAGKPFMSVEHAVHRLTGELADWYRLDAGHLRIGDRADLMFSTRSSSTPHLETYAEDTVEQYGGMSRMVNRNDDTVRPYSSAAEPFSSTASPPSCSAPSAPADSCAPVRPPPPPRQRVLAVSVNRRPTRSHRLCRHVGGAVEPGLGRHRRHSVRRLHLPRHAARTRRRGPRPRRHRQAPQDRHGTAGRLRELRRSDGRQRRRRDVRALTRTGIGAPARSAVCAFVTVHRVETARSRLWKDYWDMGALANFAPPTWVEDFATADMSWIFDATGLV